MRPQIATDEQAIHHLGEHLERTSEHTFDTVILGYRGTAFLVGVIYRDWRQPGQPVVRKDVYRVGPRGGLDRWISADTEFADHLAEFLRRGQM